MEEIQHFTKQERREMKRQLRDAQRAALGNKKMLSSILWIGGFIVVIGGLIAYIVWDITRPLVGTEVQIMESRNHVPDGQHPVYNSNPPTSGNHYAQTEEWGIYDHELVTEKLIHNLEHGGVLIFYNCEYPPIKEKERCDALVKDLKDITERLRRKDRKIILAPNSKIDSTIALSAWGWYDKMLTPDEDRIRNFFNDHINKGPERVF